MVNFLFDFESIFQTQGGSSGIESSLTNFAKRFIQMNSYKQFKKKLNMFEKTNISFNQR